MMFYWEWFRTNHGVKYDFSTSNPPPLTSEDLKSLDLKIPEIDFGKVYHGSSLELKEVIAALYRVSAENVFIGSSASDTNDTVFDTLIQRGNNILVESPVYPPLLESSQRRALQRGAKIKQFTRRAKNGFKIEPDEISDLADRNTRLIVLTNLHNPSGVKITEEEIRELTELTEAADPTIMVDEVYRRYCPELPSAYPISDRALVTDSLSKYFGATALRIGWAIGDEELMKQLESTQGYRNVVNPSFSEDIAASILKYPQFFEQRTRNHFDANYRLFQDWLRTREDVSLVRPDGPVCCFPKLETVKDTLNFVNEHLIPKYSTLVVPGEFYGLSGHIRICFGMKASTLEQGLENLSKAIDDYKE